MNQEVIQQILEKIKAYDRIMLFRHIRMDGDCVGATTGLKEILKLTYPKKEIILTDGQRSDYLIFLGEDDAPVSDESCREALGIVIDTATEDRISNPQYALCREVIKIDHHINREPYGQINWVEEERSSACEMIAAFYAACQDELCINTRAATFIYTGMVTDSGRFQYEGVTGDTLRLAGLMLDQGIDTKTLYAHLYLKDFDALKFKAYVYDQMEITPHGVASIYITKKAQGEFGLSFEEACTAISALDSIKGCLCWIAFIESDDEKQSVRVRLRSRFMAINEVAEHYRGGGHACASGATVYDQEEVKNLLKEADALVKAYKETHTDWL